MLEGLKRAFQRENRIAAPHYPLLQDISLLPDIADVRTETSGEEVTMEITRRDNTTLTASLRTPTKHDFHGHGATWQEAQQDNFLVLNALEAETPQGSIDVVDRFYHDGAVSERPTIAISAGSTHIQALPQDILIPFKDTGTSKLLRSLFLHKPTNQTDTRARFAAHSALMATVPISDLDFAALYHELAELELHESDPQAEVHYTNHANALADMQKVLAEAGHSSKGLSREEQIRFLAGLHSSSPSNSVRTVTGSFLDAYFQHEIYKKRKRIQTEQAANRMMMDRVSPLVIEMGHASSIDLLGRKADMMNYSYQLETDDFLRRNAQVLQDLGLLNEAKTIRDEYAIKDSAVQSDCHAILAQWLTQRSQPAGRPVYQFTSV